MQNKKDEKAQEDRRKEKEREEEREDRKQAMQSIAENNLNKNQEMVTQPQVKPKKNIKYHKPVNYEFKALNIIFRIIRIIECKVTFIY